MLGVIHAMSTCSGLAILLLLNTGTPHPGTAPACHKAAERDARAALLTAGLKRTAAARSQIEQMASAVPSTHVSQLAKVLLSEWSLRNDDPRLALPRLIWIRKLELSKFKEQIPDLRAPLLVIANPTVDEDGLVAECSVVKSSGHELINKAVVEEACLHARFRPARGANGYVTSNRYHIQFYLHPQL